MRELGKTGKYLGHVHPRDERRIDPEPPRPLGKASDRPKAKKRYGFKYQSRYKVHGKKWSTRTHWSYYETEKKRDQAMAQFPKTWGTFTEFRNFQPIDRYAPETTEAGVR